jgi:YfiR/HmsC-like
MKSDNANRNFPRVVLAALCAVLAVLVLGNRAISQAQMEEHEAKAAFVMKLINFVEFPSNGQGSLVIGTIGADETSDALVKLANGKSVNGKSVSVKRLAPDADLKSIDVLYIGASQSKNIASLLERARGSNALTIGETDGFDQHGGIVNLLISDGRIKFEVNPHAAERAHLQISSRLLSLATIVNGG